MPNAKDLRLRSSDTAGTTANRHKTDSRHTQERKEPPPYLLDVWSRTQPKYRRRAIILLLINIALFAGLGCFAFWLRTGRAVPFQLEDYWEFFWQCFNPEGKEQVTLIDYLLYPINVEQTPMQIVVVGLLLASLVSIPILVAMLYRLPSALPFIAIVAFVAVFPWLALTITLSCILTQVRFFRFSFRYATGLIALIPVVLYFFNATRNPSAAASYPTPIIAAALYAPWALAILSSCVVMAIVLILARLVNYRPGAIAPLLAILFAAPVVVFEAKVGRDELHYRLLEHEYGPQSRTCFRDQDAAAVIRKLAEAKVAAMPEPRRRIQDVEQEIRLLWASQLDPIEFANEETGLFAAQQHRAASACDWFCEDFPRSRYLPNALFIKGRALDMRIDVETFRRHAALRFYSGFPSQVSATTWATLYEQYPDSPASSVALYRSAQLEVRAGRIDHAVELLSQLIDRFQSHKASPDPDGGGFFANLEGPPPTSTLGIQVIEIVRRARKLKHLLEANRDPHLADAPLIEFMQCDPRHRLYIQNLQHILRRYPMSRLRDQLILEQATAQPSTSLKIRALETFLAEHWGHPAADALPEAQYRLGQAYLMDSRPADARMAFDRLREEFPESPWVEDAQEQTGQLAALESLHAAP
ncbi:MAG: tetratricopeptide repeat protein [Phycisphaerae bacterium]|nr:tetratricopeptide repeat protein [Phycisphaerae bacterium]